MSEVKGSFDIDREAVKCAFESYDSEMVKKIQIVILSSTLPNPYLLVMFGVLRLFLEEIRNRYPAVKSEIYINFLLIHEIGKSEKMGIYFEPIKEHYKFFIAHEEGEGVSVKKDISSIIEMRFEEFKTLANKIVLTLVDEKTGKKMLAKDTILNFEYDYIYDLSDKIGEDHKEVNKFMNSCENGELKNPKSELEPIIRTIFFTKIGEKEELVKYLLDIFCHKLSAPQNENALFFITDRWLKKLIGKYLNSQSPSSTIFKEIYKRLICPSEDPKFKELALYLNPISKYKVAGTEIDEKYFSSLLQKLSCELFDEPFEQFYGKVITEYEQYMSASHDLKLDLLNPEPNEEVVKAYKEKQKKYQKLLNDTIANGFLTVQEEDILAQLIYIA